MSCQKTGFHAFIVPYGIYAYGDAFELYGVTYFRICEISTKSLREVKHYTINDYQQWFDETKTSQHQNSTMICAPEDSVYHGYEGVPI